MVKFMPRKHTKNQIKSADAVDKKSAELFLSIQEKSATVDEWEAFHDWSKQSETAAKTIDAYSQLWQDVDYVSRYRMPTPEELAADSYDGSQSIKDHQRAQAVALPSCWQRLRSLLTISPVPVYAGALALLALVVTVPMYNTMVTPLEFTTHTAEHRRIVLDDGSSVFLGAETRILSDYSPHQRHITLSSGEAYFDVAKDPDRPFIVDINGLEVRAIGTAFNIRKSPASIMVSVVEGTIGLKSDDAPALTESVTAALPATLTVGEQISYAKADHKVNYAVTDTRDMLSWQSDVLFFRGETLQDVFYRLDRYTDETIILLDKDVGDLQFSGTVHRQNIDSWFDALSLAFPVNVTRVQGKILIARAPINDGPL
tara:strand:+ start:4682 stop:5794 length:1113 start_codon:yes stop_codon:yes gene_type:complete